MRNAFRNVRGRVIFYANWNNKKRSRDKWYEKFKGKKMRITLPHRVMTTRKSLKLNKNLIWANITIFFSTE